MADNGLQNASAFNSNRQLREVALAALQSASSKPGFSRQLRLKDRHLTDNRIVAASFEHPGGGLSLAQVMMVNLAADGAAVIYSGYVHPSTMVTLMLPDHAGVQIPINGNVTFCDYLVNKLHAINIQWQRPIDPLDFVDRSNLDEGCQNGEASESPVIQGRMLYLNEDRSQAERIRLMIAQSKMDFIWSKDVDAALGEIRSNPFDVVFVDTVSPHSAALDEIVRIRTEAHLGPILIGEHEGNQAQIKELRRLGYRYFLHKPVEQSRLFSILSKAIITPGARDAGTETVASSRDSSGSDIDSIAQYLDIIAQQIVKLKRAIDEDDNPAALKICGTLRATGASYGFPLVSDTASEAFTALSASCSPRESTVDLERVIAVVQALKS